MTGKSAFQPDQPLLYSQSQAHFRQMIEHANLGVMSIDANQVITYVNPMVADLLGYPVDEIIGKLLDEFFFPDDLKDHALHMTDRRQGKNEVYDRRFRRKDGTVLWTAVSAASDFDKDGRFIGSFAFLSDITRHKQQDSVLATRYHLLRYAIDHTLDDLLVESLDQICNLTNSSIGFYHFLNDDQCTLTLQAWSTQTTQNFCTAEAKGKHYNIDQAGVWVDCIYERRPVIHNDYGSLLHRKGLPDGHALVTRELVAPVIRGEKIVAILGIGNKPSNYNEDDVYLVSSFALLTWDIAEKKLAEDKLRQSEQNLRESEQRFRTLAELLPVGVFITDPNRACHYANQKWLNMTGLTLDETLRGVWDQAIYPDDREPALASWQEMIQVPGGNGLEYRLQAPDGKITWVYGLVAELKDNHGQLTGYIGVNLDITERKQMENALQNSLAEKETLLRELYHRTKNNMQVISAMISLQKSFSNNATVVDICTEMENRIKSMSLVHQKLYQTQNLSRMNLSEYIRELIALLQSSYAHNTAVKLDLDLESFPVMIDTAVPCGLIINELVSNAFKYAFPPEKLDGILRIGLHRRGADQVMLDVQDNGPGLPDGFDPHTSGRFGMSTLIALVEHQLQGQIEFRSGPGLSVHIEFCDSLSSEQV